MELSSELIFTTNNTKLDESRLDQPDAYSRFLKLYSWNSWPP